MGAAFDDGSHFIRDMVNFLDLREPRIRLLSPKVGLCLFREFEEMLCMPPGEKVRLAASHQLLGSVLSDALQHPDAALAVGIEALSDETLVDEGLQPVDHAEIAARQTDRLSGIKTTAVNENGEASEQALL